MNFGQFFTPYIIRGQEDMRRILQRKQDERQDLVDREAIFGDEKWTPPHDWRRTRGLLGQIRQEQGAVAVKEREQGEHPAPADDAPTNAAPLDLPVPQGAVRKAPAAAPTPSRPNVVEK